MKPYSLMLFGLVALDTVVTLLAITYGGATEANPIVAWCLNRSIWLFLAVKLIPVSCLIYLVERMGNQTYLRVAFWAYLVLFCIGAIKVNTPVQAAPQPSKPITKPAPLPKKPIAKPAQGWHAAVVTTYAQKFEGRKMANGSRFRHRDRVLACRSGSFGSRIELRYGQNGKTTCVLSDRGRLPLHRKDRWQFDLSRAAAKDLGLYRVVNGKTDRVVKWRYVK